MNKPAVRPHVCSLRTAIAVSEWPNNIVKRSNRPF